MTPPLVRQAQEAFEKRFQLPPAVTAYAPGRVEVLGNHTDYNEGYVLSAAIDRGTAFCVSLADDGTCRVVARDLTTEDSFEIGAPEISRRASWANYVRGVTARLPLREEPRGFNALMTGDVPRGAGLASSAALEVASAMALAALYQRRLDPLELARVAQAAEHDFAGVRCGLLDQISSLFGQAQALVLTDFRTFNVQRLPLPPELTLLVCDTGVHHQLLDSEYNERRQQCEVAARHFARACPHPVSALRDVTRGELGRHGDGLDPVALRRARHVVGENDRVLRGRELLAARRVEPFGELMYESHESSRVNFENSCPELDVVVQSARRIDVVLGARLSGGGFGGSAIVLCARRHAADVGRALTAPFKAAFGRPLKITEVAPSAGARLIE